MDVTSTFEIHTELPRLYTSLCELQHVFSLRCIRRPYREDVAAVMVSHSSPFSGRGSST